MKRKERESESIQRVAHSCNLMLLFLFFFPATRRCSELIPRRLESLRWKVYVLYSCGRPPAVLSYFPTFWAPCVSSQKKKKKDTEKQLTVKGGNRAISGKKRM